MDYVSRFRAPGWVIVKDMGIRTLNNYLKTYRKRSRLTQKEVAFLLGHRNGTVVGIHETGRRLPHPKNIIAYEAIYAMPARILFAGAYEEVAKDMRKRARKLLRRLTEEPLSSFTIRKIDFLKLLLAEEAIENMSAE
ncbi:MAG: helix-turn-helix transcriptional regulator [Elusimicrobia bacterium]|nr:helix-turn-helix transcriptional regulator [Elusimicrobiota bacterium]